MHWRPGAQSCIGAGEALIVHATSIDPEAQVLFWVREGGKNETAGHNENEYVADEHNIYAAGASGESENCQSGRGE